MPFVLIFSLVRYHRYLGARAGPSSDEDGRYRMCVLLLQVLIMYICLILPSRPNAIAPERRQPSHSEAQYHQHEQLAILPHGVQQPVLPRFYRPGRQRLDPEHPPIRTLHTPSLILSYLPPYSPASLSQIATSAGRSDITITPFSHTFLQTSTIVRFPGAGSDNAITILGAHMDSINSSNPMNGRAPGAGRFSPVCREKPSRLNRRIAFRR